MKVDLAKRRRVMERSLQLGHCICDPRRPCPCDVFRNQGICPCAGERPDPPDLSELKLTQLVRNAGCASKIAPADLEAILGRLPKVEDPRVISGLAAADDAAIYRIAEDLCLVQTVDVFTPCVDDPHLFGRICAANCLSDIYAMGGQPHTALSIVSFPSESLPGDILCGMLAGAMETLGPAGVALIGGHSIKDDEIKLGFAITGLINPQTAAALQTPQLQDLLILTKPLGTGVLAFGQQVGRLYPEGLAAAEQSMATLNKSAADAMVAAGASACTDITGFGLFGHLIRMIRPTGLAAHLFAEALPAFPDVLRAIREGLIPGAVERNREFVGDNLVVAPEVDEAFVHLGLDAQTSGGLLIAVAPDRLRNLQLALQERGAQSRVVGRLVDVSTAQIILTRSDLDSPNISRSRPLPTAQPDSLPAPTSAPTTPEAATDPARDPASSSQNPSCCAEALQPQSSPGPIVDAQRAFGALMRAVQAPGALDPRTKELIQFSLIALSRCGPCFEAHLQTAREMGITQAELDEAVWCAIAMGGAPVRMFYKEQLQRAQARQDNNSNHSCC